MLLLILTRTPKGLYFTHMGETPSNSTVTKFCIWVPFPSVVICARFCLYRPNSLFGGRPPKIGCSDWLERWRLQQLELDWLCCDNSDVLLVFTLRTRNSSGDEIANVNFLYNNVVHAVQNTIDSCINSATDQHGYVLEHNFAEFSEIMQCNSHYVVQGHSTSPILVLIESSYTITY